MPLKQPTILLVDDDPVQLALITATLERRRRCRTLTSTSSLEGLELARAEAPDLAVCDVVMPDMDGIELTRILRAEFPSMPVIILTGRDDPATADAAYAAGATDFAVKPLDPVLLLARIEHALREAPAKQIAREATKTRFPTEVLGSHRRIQELRVFVANVASVPGIAALLLGESGTGKNLVARAIHAATDDDDARFVEINCAALPANLLEAELFGYEKGAFTDARQAKQGLVEVAAGGTLFLDEIGTLSMELQAKLLSFLESRHFRRVGGTTDRSVELRVVAATNADLNAEIAYGRFREDLYYRLNVAHLTLPPLRDVRSDIPAFVRHFVARAADYFRKPTPEIDEECLDALQSYAWPGNLRELRNVVERALIFHKGGLLRLDVPGSPAASAARGGIPLEGTRDADRVSGAAGSVPTAAPPGGLIVPLGLTLEELERRYIEATMAASDGQVAKAAEVLGVTRKVLWARRKSLGLID
jgi:two-component system, NtrC family, response regulator AtoC